MRKSLIQVQQGVASSVSDEKLLFIQQMGVKYIYVLFKNEDSNYDSVMRFKERAARFGLEITDAGNVEIYKCPSIHLGLPDRDKCIKRYNDFTRVLGKAGIHTGYMTWEPNGVQTTRFGVGQYTRGAIGRIVDVDQLKTLPFSHERQYTEEKIWDNFKYFLDRALPVCEESDVRIALHPCDPPVSSLRGVCNLICSAESYKRAFELAGNSPFLGMKLCVGCWLEGGVKFGDLMEDIRYFCENKKILVVHFRNVSSPLPRFEETLLEDGYMDMYRVMQQLVRCNYDGTITVDHVPEFVQECGGKDAAFAYSIGYMKALLNCAEAEAGRQLRNPV
jgi:mannonate dehydratase